MPSTQLHGPITPTAVHLCLDMQNLFAPGAAWGTPWLPRVLPVVEAISSRFPERTVFTQFLTPNSGEEMPGTWANYYRKWSALTRDRVDPALFDVLPELQRYVPPATVLKKYRYSAFAKTGLADLLHERRADTLVITGSETDVCVVATVFAAVDRGLRVIIVKDGICSSSDEGHDAMLKVYGGRCSEQIEIADAETILSAWN